MQNDRPDPPTFDGESFGAALRAAVDGVFGFAIEGKTLDGDNRESAVAALREPACREKLVAFGTMLAERSRVVNLTRLTEPEDMAVLHFLDSYHLACALKPPSARVCDIGTGGGVPGIPLAIMRPDLQVTLIDSTAKKIAFVKEAITTLGLANARAVQVRAEEHLRFNPYGAAVLRAAVKPDRMFEILEACRNSLESVVFMLGGDGPRIAGAIESRAYKLVSCEPYSLPGQDRERHIAIFTRNTRKKRRR